MPRRKPGETDQRPNPVRAILSVQVSTTEGEGAVVRVWWDQGPLSDRADLRRPVFQRRYEAPADEPRMAVACLKGTLGAIEGSLRHARARDRT